MLSEGNGSARRERSAASSSTIDTRGTRGDRSAAGAYDGNGKCGIPVRSGGRRGIFIRRGGGRRRGGTLKVGCDICVSRSGELNGTSRTFRSTALASTPTGKGSSCDRRRSKCDGLRTRVLGAAIGTTINIILVAIVG